MSLFLSFASVLSLGKFSSINRYYSPTLILGNSGNKLAIDVSLASKVDTGSLAFIACDFDLDLDYFIVADFSACLTRLFNRDA